MDAFKAAEIQRMEKGSNASWKTFFDSHPFTVSEGRTFEDATIKERYDSEVGEEYKERLTAKVEGRQYIPGERKLALAGSRSRSSTPIQSAGTGRASPAFSDHLGGGRKARSEAYFAKLGSENASRREDIPPSQGGKYGGIEGGIPVSSAPRNQDAEIPDLNDFQKDPVAALSKGFSWFTSTVGKGAKTVNDACIQPTAKSVCFPPLVATAILSRGDHARWPVH
jgi:ADP-ribosylation factor GTPase-activating protein 1